MEPLALLRRTLAVVVVLGAATQLSTAPLASAEGEKSNHDARYPAFCRTVRASEDKLQKLTLTSPAEYGPRAGRQVAKARAQFKRIAVHAPTHSLALDADTSQSLLGQLQDVATLKYGPTSQRKVDKMVATYLDRTHLLKEAADQYCRHGHRTRPTDRVYSSAKSQAADGAATISEQQGSRGVDTFADYHNASGVGQHVNPWTRVAVSCKVYDPTITSVNPDGYWYRLASAPWYGAYYAPANTFMNGDPVGGPYTHNTDFAVPDCGTTPPPPTATSSSDGSTCPTLTGDYYKRDSIPLFVKLFGHYLKGGGGAVVLDWNYFSHDKDFVKTAKGMAVGQKIYGWSADLTPVTDPDLVFGLGGFEICHPSASQWMIYDSYDFTPSNANLKQVVQAQIYFPLWIYQIGTAQDFFESASGTL